MKQDILNALGGNKAKYNSIMRKSRDRNIVNLRWEVWTILYAKSYTLEQIGEHFGMSHSTVLHGLRKSLEKTSIEKIKSKIIKFR